MSHPSLGLPPRDSRAGFEAAAARVRDARERLAARALEVALDDARDMRDRYDEIGLRQLLIDAALIIDQVATGLAERETNVGAKFAEQSAIVYRRRRVPMDDLIALSEGIRAALPSTLVGEELEFAGEVLDRAEDVYRWHRRLAGDARKRNALLQFLYKGG
ncbi:MAG: hypothetical protein ACJ761_03930 [Chloroflexota bacterium]